ncbi:hypothetical protein T440DRAFT_511736 [Plenodomus tracheiphilus IPT5]|uniref:Uncharacterized protein n=1 Tax=Plenodomus tracheiphilus IPT5 TaxID=1408161 RepID=A0A6A7AQ27_9PLEO|nr:hypothetical protein T440DRAFT_511736 [Plenodomus tracheiphilus IPT5]
MASTPRTAQPYCEAAALTSRREIEDFGKSNVTSRRCPIIERRDKEGDMTRYLTDRKGNGIQWDQLPRGTLYIHLIYIHTHVYHVCLRRWNSRANSKQKPPYSEKTKREASQSAWAGNQAHTLNKRAEQESRAECVVATGKDEDDQRQRPHMQENMYFCVSRPGH